jgi:hypothetical protein
VPEIDDRPRARYQEMDEWSQAMIAGIANYGVTAVDAMPRSDHRDDEAIDDMLPVVRRV